MVAAQGSCRSKLKRRTGADESIDDLFHALDEEGRHLFRLILESIVEEINQFPSMSPTSQKRPRQSALRRLARLSDEEIRRCSIALSATVFTIDSCHADPSCHRSRKRASTGEGDVAASHADEQFICVFHATTGEQLCSIAVASSLTLDRLQKIIDEETGVPVFLQKLSFPDDGAILNNETAFGNAICSGRRSLILQRLDPARLAVLPCLSRGEGSLDELGVDMRGDREMVLAAVSGNGMELRFAAEELRADREVVLTAVRRSGYALKFAAENMKRDHDVVLEAVRQRGLALQFASRELQARRSVALAAVQRDADALRFVAANLRSDPEIARTAVACGGFESFLSADIEEEDNFELCAPEIDEEDCSYDAAKDVDRCDDAEYAVATDGYELV